MTICPVLVCSIPSMLLLPNLHSHTTLLDLTRESILLQSGERRDDMADALRQRRGSGTHRARAHAEGERERGRGVGGRPDIETPTAPCEYESVSVYVCMCVCVCVCRPQLPRCSHRLRHLWRRVSPSE
jgi:hypothetical protein